MWLNGSMAFKATTSRIVVQFGFAMMPRGRLRASSGLTSGTTKGTSSSILKALELSIITAPYLVIVSANSFEVPPPAETKAMSMSLKSSLCCKSFTVSGWPRNRYWVPALRFEPNNTNSSIGKFLSSNTRRNSCPTAPLAPTIAIFIFSGFKNVWLLDCKINVLMISKKYPGRFFHQTYCVFNFKHRLSR